MKNENAGSKTEGELAALAGSETTDYQKITYAARDILNCGHVRNVPDALATLHTRYNDALARIATLEAKSPNVREPKSKA